MFDLDQVRNQRVMRAIENLPPELKGDLLASQSMVVKQDPYYSRGRIAGTVSGENLVFTKDSLTLFDYAIGDTLGNAKGFTSSSPYDKATRADTNLITKNETNGAEFFFIDGIGIVLEPMSDPILAAKIFSECACSISLEGKDGLYQLGLPFFMPGGAGLVGGGLTAQIANNLNDPIPRVSGFPSNGFQSPFDYKHLHDCIAWCPKGKRDSTLQFRVELTRSLTLAMGTTRAEDVADNNDVQGWTNPAATYDPWTWVGFWVVLHGIQITPRSGNR